MVSVPYNLSWFPFPLCLPYGFVQACLKDVSSLSNFLTSTFQIISQVGVNCRVAKSNFQSSFDVFRARPFFRLGAVFFILATAARLLLGSPLVPRAILILLGWWFVRAVTAWYVPKAVIEAAAGIWCLAANLLAVLWPAKQTSAARSSQPQNNKKGERFTGSKLEISSSQANPVEAKSASAGAAAAAASVMLNEKASGMNSAAILLVTLSQTS